MCVGDRIGESKSDYLPIPSSFFLSMEYGFYPGILGTDTLKCNRNVMPQGPISLSPLRKILLVLVLGKFAFCHKIMSVRRDSKVVPTI